MTGATRRRIGALVVAIPLAVAGSIVGFAGWLFAGLRCDDACSTVGSSWRSDVDAWQWSAQGWLALAIFLACLAGAILLVADRRRPAAVVTGIGLALFVVWFALLSSG